MSGDRIDRRVKRTDEGLRKALIELILEKGYQRTTVQDIIDRADVGRSTFYAHFRDKEDLLLSGFARVRPSFDADGAPSDDGGQEHHDPTLALFQHALEFRGVYKAMVGRGGAEVVRRYLHRTLTEVLRAHLNETAPEQGTRVPVDVTVEFAVSSLEGILYWWLNNDAPYSPEEMDQLYRDLVEPGVRAAMLPKG